jgi:hypothetical protein
MSINQNLSTSYCTLARDKKRSTYLSVYILTNVNNFSFVSTPHPQVVVNYAMSGMEAEQVCREVLYVPFHSSSFF